MTELFNLAGKYQQVYEMMTDPDVDEQTVNDTLEALMGEIEVSAGNLLPVIDRIDMEMDACKKHRDEWDRAYEVRKNRRSNLLNLIKMTMIKLGVNEIKAGDVTYKLQNNGGVLPLIVDEGKQIPQRFTKVTIEKDNDLIRKALDDGEELDFARYGERGKQLRIKR